MKRAASILLALLVGIVVLTHSVVPHHHHNGLFAAVVNVFGEDGHQHEENTDTEECFIDDAAAAAVSQRGNWTATDLNHFIHGWQLPSFFVDIFNTALAEPFITHVAIATLYLARCHSAFTARAMGLRAPPFC